MTQVPIHDELMDNEKKIASYRFCCPIFITDMFGIFLANEKDLHLKSSDESNIRSGTLTFVSYENQVYGITCRHVVQELERKNKIKHKEHMGLFGKEHPFVAQAQMHFFFPKGNQQIHINSMFHKAPGDALTKTYPDLAVARISAEKMSQIGREHISLDNKLLSQSKWPEDSCGIATGYPEQKRATVSSCADLNTLAISAVVAVSPFGRVSEAGLSMYYELDEEPDADNLSGMSGGPILWTNEINWGLAGIVKKGRDMKIDPDKNSNSTIDSHVIWIEGESITQTKLTELIEAIPKKEEYIPDLSKTLYVASKHTPT